MTCGETRCEHFDPQPDTLVTSLIQQAVVSGIWVPAYIEMYQILVDANSRVRRMTAQMDSNCEVENTVADVITDVTFIDISSMIAYLVKHDYYHVENKEEH